MFAPDIVTLQQFYDSPFGRDVSALVLKRIHALWPSAQGDVILGVGYCNPFLRGLMEDCANVGVVMPAQQGAAYWPPEGQNRVLLAHEAELPVPDNSMNRVLLIHSFEHTEHLSALIAEIRRVLVPGGRALIVVPNRMGLWCHSSRSPFGYGRTFSAAQLADLLAPHQFVVTRTSSALFMPPWPIRLLWKAASKMEAIGRFICPFIGGVLLVEAQKQIYASIKQPVHVRSGYAPPVRAGNPALGSSSKI